ncbi:MAG: hypothetical protein AAGA12_03195 [Pseudomonadota bacterium]
MPPSDSRKEMHRRSFIALSAATTAAFAAGPAAAAANGDGFDAVLKAGSRDDLSAAERIIGLEQRGYRPVQGAERKTAAQLLGDSVSMFDIRPLSGAPTSRAFHRASLSNTSANIERRSSEGRVSALMAFDEPAGRIYAYLLQDGAGERIFLTAACTHADSVNGFLSRFIDPLDPMQPGIGFDRAEFGKKPKSNPRTKARLITTRINTQEIRSILGTSFSAAGNFMIKTRPA